MTDALRPHERWWEDHADTTGTFRQWLDDSDPWSRAEVASIVREAGATSVCEVGPGLYHDWQAVWRQQPGIEYTAVELTPKLVAHGRALGVDVQPGSITDIPLEDGAVDVAYCRHVLEHLEPADISRAMAELIRVSRRAAVVVLFRSTAEPHHEFIEDTSAAPGTYCHCISRTRLAMAAHAAKLRPSWSHGGRDWVLTLTW